MLIKIYRYLYYKLYCWALYMNFDNTPEFTAFFSIVILGFLNFLCIIWLIEIAFKLPKVISNWSGVIVIILIGIPQSFMLIHNGKYKKIAQEFQKESRARSRKGNLFAWVYIVSPFIKLYFLVWLE
jgi:uncharacterized protein (DUF983 family)